MSDTPKTADGQPEQRATDAPPVDATHASDERVALGAPAADPGKDMPRIGQTGDQPQRRRRRRRRPRRDPAGAGSVAAAAESSAAPPQSPDRQAAAEGSLTAPVEQALPSQPTTSAPPRKRRRRRRRPPPEGSAAPGAAREPASDASGAAAQPSPATERKEPRRSRASHRRGGPHRISGEERPRERDDRKEPSGGPRADRDRGKRDKRGARAPTERPRRRERDDARNKPAPKLHRLEAIVDRGFEDVPDPATEGATRRADWTILKRTTADQRTARAISVIYVLRRDGVETEFAQLSAARAAVNKIITHPEKLTPSKADRAAAKGAKK